MSSVSVPGTPRSGVTATEETLADDRLEFPSPEGGGHNRTNIGKPGERICLQRPWGRRPVTGLMATRGTCPSRDSFRAPRLEPLANLRLNTGYVSRVSRRPLPDLSPDLAPFSGDASGRTEDEPVNPPSCCRVLKTPSRPTSAVQGPDPCPRLRGEKSGRPVRAFTYSQLCDSLHGGSRSGGAGRRRPPPARMLLYSKDQEAGLGQTFTRRRRPAAHLSMAAMDGRAPSLALAAGRGIAPGWAADILGSSTPRRVI
jgi:hypothetical protein